MSKNTHYSSIHGWMEFEQLYEDMYAKLPNNATIVECGNWLGRSACFMADLIANGDKKVRFDCIDLFDDWMKPHLPEIIDANDGTIVDVFCNNLRKGGVLKYVNVIQANSLQAVKMYEDKSLDFVFLDDNHEYEHLLAEMNCWFPKIKSGGFIAGHDYTNADWPGVRKAIDEFTSTNNIPFKTVFSCFLIEVA